MHPPQDVGTKNGHETKSCQKDLGDLPFFFCWKTWGELGAGFKDI